MSLSICFLTRDAESKIARAIQSVAPLRAEVIVGDTGSHDRTVEVAQQEGATVHQVPWKDDFAAAQNWILERATGDWVLWLNPDEELLTADPEQMNSLLTRSEALAYLVRVQQLMRRDQVEKPIETWNVRLYRRQADLIYQGRLHPHFVPSLEEIARRHKKEIFRSYLVLRHHAYESVLNEEKLRWVNRLLQLELQDRPGQLHYLTEYGRNLLRLNDPQGHVVLAEAAELLLSHADATVPPTPTVGLLLEYLLTVSPQQSHSSLTWSQVTQLVGRWFPNSPPLIWAIAQQAFKAEEYRIAAEGLSRLVQMGRTGGYDHTLAFDPGVIGDPALLNLGVCHLHLGDPVKAEACFGPLLSSSQYQQQARRGWAQAQELRQRQSEKSSEE